MEVEVFDFGVVAVDGDVGDGVSDFAGILEVSQTLSEDVGVDVDDTLARAFDAYGYGGHVLVVHICAKAVFGQAFDGRSGFGHAVGHINDGYLTVLQVAGLVGDSSNVLLIAYGELGESGAVYGAAEGFLGQDFCCNLAGGIELGYLVVLLNHPECAVGVGVDLGSSAAVFAVSVCLTGGIFQGDGVHIVVAATVLNLEVYDFVGVLFGEPYTTVVERSAECYGSTGDDAGCVFLDQYTRLGAIVVPDVYAEVLFFRNDIGSDELAVGYGEASEFAESVAEVSHGE